MTRIVTLTFPVDDPEITEIMHQATENLASLATYRNEHGLYDNNDEASTIAGEKVEGEPNKKIKAPAAPEKKTNAPAAPEKTTEETGPEKTTNAPDIAADAEIDDEGYPHDSRVHRPTKAKSKKAPFIWLLIRGTDKDLIAQYRKDWEDLGYGPELLATRATTQETTTVAPVAPEAPGTVKAPVAPKAPLPPEKRMTPESNHVPYESFKSVTPPWTDQQMIDAGKLYPEDWHPEEEEEGEDVSEAAPIMDFTTLIVEVCSPNLESGKVTQEQIDGIVSEVTGGAATAVSLIPQSKAEEHIPAIVERINRLIAQ